MFRDDLTMIELLCHGEAAFLLSKSSVLKLGRKKFLRKWLKGHAEQTTDERLAILIRGQFLSRKTDNQLDKYWVWSLDFYKDMIITLSKNARLSDEERLENYYTVLAEDCNFNVDDECNRTQKPALTIEKNTVFRASIGRGDNITVGSKITIHYHHYSRDHFDTAKAILQDYGFSLISQDTSDTASSLTFESAFHCPNVIVAEEMCKSIKVF